jgi:hypothetical protein
MPVRTLPTTMANTIVQNRVWGEIQDRTKAGKRMGHPGFLAIEGWGQITI